MAHNTDILEDKSISHYGKLIYFALSKYADKNGSCWPSLATIAEMSGVSVRTVQKTINELTNSQWVIKEKRKSKHGDFDTNLYLLPKLEVRHDMPNGMALRALGVRHDVPTNLSNRTYPINYISVASKSATGKKESKKFIPPSVEEVTRYCLERKNRINPEQFIDFYSAKNWYIGKNKMKDWKSAVRTWERNKKNFQREGVANDDVPFL